MTRATRIDVAFLVVAVALSASVLPYRVVACFPEPPGGNDTSPRALAAGVGTTPYQYRVLVPWLVRGAVAAGLLPSDADIPAFVALEGLALVALACAFRQYLSLFIDDRLVTSVAALSAYAVLPFNDLRGPFLPYDTPSIVFFATGLVLIRRQSWRWFFPLFTLATLNRETSIFLTAAFAVALYDEYRPSRLALLGGAQIAIWIAIKAALWQIYRQNPSVGASGLYFFQLKVNLATILSRPIASLIVLSTWGGLWLTALIWHARISDRFLRRTLWVVPMFMAGMFVVGFVVEMRVYGEMLPIVLAAFWVGLLSLVSQALREGHLSRAAGRNGTA